MNNGNYKIGDLVKFKVKGGISWGTIVDIMYRGDRESYKISSGRSIFSVSEKDILSK